MDRTSFCTVNRKANPHRLPSAQEVKELQERNAGARSPGICGMPPHSLASARFHAPFTPQARAFRGAVISHHS